MASASAKIHVLTPAYIDRRKRGSSDTSISAQDSGQAQTETIRIGFNPDMRKKLSADRIVITHPIDERIELNQKLELTEIGRFNEDWSGRKATIMRATAKILPFEKQNMPSRVDGLSLSTCRSLENKFGEDYAKKIAADKTLLSNTKFSKNNKTLILKCCRQEALAAKDGTYDKKVFEALVCAGHTNSESRLFAKAFNNNASPYQFFLAGTQTFLQADRFAKHLGIGSESDRTQAIVMQMFVDNLSTIVSRNDIAEITFKNYGIDEDSCFKSIKELVQQNILKEFNNPTADRQIKYFGTKANIEAEQYLAKIFSKNVEIEISDQLQETIDHVIEHCAEYLGRPGFELDEDQILFLQDCFKRKYIILTGPPGSGKTAICALVNLITCLETGESGSALGAALAGRAASNLREAAWTKYKNKKLNLYAATIEKLLHTTRPTQPTCTTLIIDEASMINSQMLARLLRHVTHKRAIFVGDVNQLPPIGSGKPFSDICEHSPIDVHGLFGNYRTDCKGLRLFLEDLESGCSENVYYSQSQEHYEKDGSVELCECNAGMKSLHAAEIYEQIVKSGVDPFDVAILSPHNKGDEGTREINIQVRRLLGFNLDHCEIGDTLIITENNYKASLVDNETDFTTIYNGERCRVINKTPDSIDVEFLPDGSGEIRRVQLELSGMLPEGTAFGYAFSTHKAQGSQANHVIMLTARSGKKFGIVQRSIIYTAASRARDKLWIVGDFDELLGCIDCDEIERETALGILLKSSTREG